MVHESLAQEQEDAIEMIQTLSRKMFKITDESTESLINLRNQVTKLYCRYDTAKHDALYWESVVNKVEGMTAKQTVQLDRVKNACYNLYIQMCDHLNIKPSAEKNEIRKQLTIIEKTIVELRRAIYLVKRKLEKK